MLMFICTYKIFPYREIIIIISEMFLVMYIMLIYAGHYNDFVTLSESDIAIMTCMFRKGAIQSQHFPIEAIAKKCHVGAKKALKKQLKRLTNLGYVERHKPTSFSLSPEGVKVAKDSQMSKQ